MKNENKTQEIKITTKTNTQRQREYRERARKELARLNMWIDFGANIKLEDVAGYYAVTKKELLEKMIAKAHKDWVDEIGQEAYMAFIDEKVK